MSEENVAVRLENVSLKFNLAREKLDTLKDYVIHKLYGQVNYEEFWALKNINFTLNKGDRLGILGLNGAGKSTLLKVIAQVYRPTTGNVTRNGVIAPLLELGAGFDSEYTARENIYLYGAVLGYSKEFVTQKYDEIIKFAELEKFENVPIKNFSSGMKSRLGFSICTAVNPDILILDEVLAVGDAKFKKKSEAKIQSLFKDNVTVLFVSHNLDQVKKICNKGMIMDHGEMVAFGDIDAVCEQYQNMINS